MMQRLYLTAAAVVLLVPIAISPIVAVGAVGAANALQTMDGPYVLLQGRTARELRVTAEGVAHERATRIGRTVEIPAVGNVPAFRVRLRATPRVGVPFQFSLAETTPLFVVADTHGEYEIFVELLRRQNIIDVHLRWRFGRGHVVVLGDIFDRGAHQTEILWLLYKLEAEALRAGGRVHVLLGNHETMILRDDLRYLHPRYPTVASTLQVRPYGTLFSANSVLGAWLRSRPAMLRLGRSLFLHGGVSPALVESGFGIGEINAIVRASLEVPVTVRYPLDPAAALVMGPSGPLWYRGYFAQHPPQASQADIEASLRHFGVERIFVGHTIVDSVRLMHEGRIVAVQVYPRLSGVTREPMMEATVRVGRRWYRATARGERFPLT